MINFPSIVKYARCLINIILLNLHRHLQCKEYFTEEKPEAQIIIFPT